MSEKTPSRGKPTDDTSSPGTPPDEDLLESVIQRIFAAGLLLNARVDGVQLSERVEQAVAELDEALRSIRLIAVPLQRRPVDLDRLLVRLSEASDDVARLGEERRDSGPGSPLDEASRYLYRARMSLLEVHTQPRGD